MTTDWPRYRHEELIAYLKKEAEKSPFYRMMVEGAFPKYGSVNTNIVRFKKEEPMTNTQNMTVQEAPPSPRSALDIALDHTINVEGRKYTNHPKDKGGPTKFGITLNTLKAYRGSATAKDVENLEEAEARQIFKVNYWDRMNLGFVDGSDFRVPLALMDQGVNRGTRTAWIMAQVTMNTQFKTSLQVDGIPGPKTLGALHSIKPDFFCREFIQAAQHGYVDIVKRKPDQMVFLTGWLNRTHILQDLCWSGTGFSTLPPLIVPHPDESIVIPKKPAGSLAPYNSAKKEMGTKEIAGSKHNPRIVWYHSFTTLKATTDETPWCSSFVCAMLEVNGYKSTRSAAARSFEKYGAQGDGSIGDIAVLKRGTNGWSGHVAFVNKKYKTGDRYIELLGGNQSNTVRVSNYDAANLLSFRRVV